MEDNKPEQELIQPTAFKPVDPGQLTSKKSWLSPVSIVLLALFLLLVGIASYIFTARSVYLSFEPEVESLNIDGGLSFQLGERYLLREGEYRISARAEGHEELKEKLTVVDEQNQTFAFLLQKLPGILRVQSNPEGAKVLVDGEQVGVTPLEGIKISPGPHQLEVAAERYVPEIQQIDVEGLNKKVSIEAELLPAWAPVSLSSIPSQARIIVDGEEKGITPSTIELVEGDYELSLQLEGYEAWQQSLVVKANQALTVPEIKLQEEKGSIRLITEPAKANITVNEKFVGQSPMDLPLDPGKDYRINIFKAGYQPASRTLAIQSGVAKGVTIKLTPILANMTINTVPKGAKVYVAGAYKGLSGSTFSLPAQRLRVVVRKSNYADFQGYITPRQGLDQKITLRLKTLEQVKWESVKPEITSPGGQRLKLFRAGSFTMGSSRREIGRRANEILKKIKLQRAFYLAENEVTNTEYRRFVAGHDSGSVKTNSLNGENQPVVSVTWEQAALYCNWLSEQASLPPAYKVEKGKVVGFDQKSTGFRLPTEAEWAWAARTTPNGLLKFPWGKSLPPPEQAGNYADLSASYIVGRIINKYSDTYAVTAPVASFKVNTKGLYDLGGNVAEWVNDFYGTQINLSGKLELDPVGPKEGKYHVIRGSSWAHGDVTELRLSYRGYGDTSRNDVGFRIARYLE